MENDAPNRQNGSVSFRPHARLIRLLGDELISDEVMAIVELVKNGYDADASHVTVTLDTIIDPSHGLISISDNGCGMDLHALLHMWMEPATSHKQGRKGNKARTARGRVLLGEKGVGRFAADKLGAELELITRHAEAEEELVLRVNWHHFDYDTYLDDIKSSWYAREPLVFTGRSHGTLLTIRSLRATWNQEMVTKLYNGLTRLVSPFTNSTDFTIEVHCPEFPCAHGRVINRLIETAPYRLVGEVDPNGMLSMQNETELSIDLRPLCHNHFFSTPGEMRQPSCGSFIISLNVWDLELQVGNGFGVDRTLREAIKLSSGVSIYRDGFRVWPYGEKDDDWLELNQRRVNNPTLRISNNQIIGFIEITQAENPNLRDRTSREGLIDTSAFFDLKALILAALSELEIKRFEHRRQVQVPRQTSEEEHDELFQYLSRVQSDKKEITRGQATSPSLKEVARLYRQRIEQEQARYDHVSKLAGVGMAAELLTDAFSHEIGRTVRLLRILQGEIHTGGANSSVQQLVETLAGHMELLNEQLDVMEPLYRPWLQKNEPVNVKGVTYDAVSVLRYKLTESHTQVRIEGSQNLTVRLNRGHIMQVLMIIFDNALAAMKEASTLNPCFEIQIVEEKEYSGLLIADSGPGIPQSHQKLIFDPHFSSQKMGRGLGLHIARDILAIYNSSLELAPDKSSLLGACFEIRFDRRRVITQHTID